MKKSCLLLLLFLINQCFSYQSFNKRVDLKELQNNLQKNIEIYESIKECNVSDIATCGDICNHCYGNGIILCNYCHGTGFLTMGDAIIGTGNKCPVCMGKGEIECKKCMGSGYIAKWRL